MSAEQIFVASVAGAAYLIGWYASKAHWFQKHDQFLSRFLQTQMTEIHNRTSKIEGIAARLHVQEGRIGEIRRRLYELAQSGNSPEKQSKDLQP